MATNGFGSIYPRSYWGVTDAENGFGNVYKDLAGGPTIQYSLGDIELNLGTWYIQVYLTNPAIPTIAFGINADIKIDFYDVNNQKIAGQTTNIGIKRNDLIVENNLKPLVLTMISPYNPNIVYAKGKILLVKDPNSNPLPNPFPVDGTNYLVTIIPTI
jgi:hypothetical protein